MKTFLTQTFISKENLKENNINYSIGLEYYKIKNEKNYGIEIVKKEYREKSTKVENMIINQVTKEEGEIEKIIYKLKENAVTPIHLKEIIEDMKN